MIMEELKSRGFNSPYNILATDISSAILEKAKVGTYSADKAAMIPTPLLKKYFDIQEGYATIHRSLKQNMHFQKFNLVSEADYGLISKRFEFIFCRNVLIYFDQATQLKVLENLVSKLAPGGILFLGHSETLLGRHFNLKQLQPTIYQKLHV